MPLSAPPTAWIERFRRGALGRVRDRYFVAYRADEPVAATFRARQLQAVLRLAPLTMLANAVNATLIVVAFWGVANDEFLALWALAIGFVVWRGMRVWWRTRRRDTPASASPRAMRRATLHASVLAALWAVAPVVLFPGAGPAHQLLVAVITTGMMCAGGFALATTPVAGTAYVLILGAGAAAMLVQARFSLVRVVGALAAVYAYIVVASVWSTARMFGARLMAEAEAARQNEVIGLLLRDFEENASDVLWEVDAEARLCRVSPKLAALFAVPAAELTATPIFDVLARVAPDDERGTDQVDAFRRRFRCAEPFRDAPLAIARDGRLHWWAVTAKPLLDAQGRPCGWRGVATDITKAQSAKQQLTWLAHFDALTGLANRHQFRTRLAELLAPGATPAASCAVLCLDLDHFKIINDTFGHAVGDGLLQEVARRLLASTRRSDTVARLGGDEFAIILRDVGGLGEVEQLTLRVLGGLKARCEVQGALIAVRASVGVVLVQAIDDDIDAVLNHADLALYTAKAAGGGEYRVFEPPMAAPMRRRLLIEQALREALERDELSLVYQPQIDLASWKVIGFEALLRWRHRELGDVAPAEFIPVAEETGLIRAIGPWVLAEACREAMHWPNDLTVSVNVSPVQAMSHDLTPIVLGALRDSGLAARRLELEITESVFINDTDTTLAILHSLRDAGLRIALDDFGTGYSSLAYLRTFPFDTLKIDRSFVNELLLRRDSRAIVRMIFALAGALHMKVVAEGVEEMAQAGLLERYGCGSMQGYLVARPMPADQVAGFLANWARMPRPELQPATPSALMVLADPA